MFAHPVFMATSLNRGGVEATPSQRVATRILISPGEHATFLENITRYPGEKRDALRERENVGICKSRKITKWGITD